ncbi:hypothetical protein V2G26_009951 [Clonostachys chloroleuca]
MGDHAPATEPSLCHGPQRLQFWSKVFQIGTGFSDYDAGARNWNAENLGSFFFTHRTVANKHRTMGVSGPQCRAGGE